MKYFKTYVGHGMVPMRYNDKSWTSFKKFKKGPLSLLLEQLWITDFVTK